MYIQCIYIYIHYMYYIIVIAHIYLAGLPKPGKPRILTFSAQRPRGRLEVRLPCSWDKKPRTGNPAHMTGWWFQYIVSIWIIYG